MYRASESDRVDALFDDPYARRMAGDLGASIAREALHGDAIAWGVIVRTAVMDEMILGCIEQGATQVVNLGAGLDTRAFRLNLPSSVRWFDVDLPRVVTHRRACLKGLKPRCQHAHVVADVTDTSELKRALSTPGIGDGKVLVVCEGLLVYLKPDQVVTLATNLNSATAVRWWLTDVVSHMMLCMMGSKWPTNEAAATAPFQFAPRDCVGFFERLGWREEAFRSILDEAVRLQRAPPMIQWWSAFAAPWWPGARENVRRMSGVVLMRKEHGAIAV